MAAELQSLIDKINSDGIAKAEAQAAAIIDAAKAKAAGIVADAEKAAADYRKKAEVDARLFQSRAEQTVSQSARDVKLGVQEAVDETISRVFQAEVKKTLTPDFLKTLIADVVMSYARGGADSDIQVELSADQVDALRDFVVKAAKDRAADGVTVASDRDISSGFRVSLQGGRVEHDFTGPAIAAAMSRQLRPAIAKLIQG